MNIQLGLVSSAIGIIIFFGIIFLMIGKKSNANVSLIWIMIAVVVMILGFFPQIIEWLSFKVGISYPPTLVLVIAITGLLWIVFYMSSQLSVAQTKIRELAMQISLLNSEMADMKEKEEDV